MKTLIICKSIHVGNTERVAERMAKILKTEVIKPEEFNVSDVGKYDLIGFGSGIYSSKHHKSLLNLVDKLPDLKPKKIFVFSTAGIVRKSNHRSLKEKLKEKNAVVVDEFFCLGFNKNSFLKYFGGMNKGRPDENDFKRAEDFARQMIEEAEKETKREM